MSTEEGDKLHVVTADDISNNKKRLGKFLVEVEITVALASTLA